MFLVRNKDSRAGVWVLVLWVRGAVSVDDGLTDLWFFESEQEREPCEILARVMRQFVSQGFLGVLEWGRNENHMN